MGRLFFFLLSPQLHCVDGCMCVCAKKGDFSLAFSFALCAFFAFIYCDGTQHNKEYAVVWAAATSSALLRCFFTGASGTRGSERSIFCPSGVTGRRSATVVVVSSSQTAMIVVVLISLSLSFFSSLLCGVPLPIYFCCVGVPM